jgi:prepilin-type N-terminal cleavage/methylation domain-containing protein
MAIKFSQKGFTLIEMLVVISIFAVVSTVLLFHYSDFSTNAAVDTLSQEIALSVRKAQSYATSVRSLDGTNSITSDTFPAYGISFSVNPTAQTVNDPTDSSFILFADASPQANGVTSNTYNNDGICGTPAVGSECVENFGITADDKIVSLCTGTDAGNDCTNKTVDVVFHRPNPDAIICIPNATNDGCVGTISDLEVTVQSPKGLQHVITIWNTGQISVN